MIADSGGNGDAVEAEHVQRGERLFRIYCSTCHGSEARGDGPMGDGLTRAPSDLTRLHEGGRRWADDAKDLLIGAAGLGRVGAHGRREMPVWGVSLMDRGRVDAQSDEIDAEIDSLMAFLRFIQVSRHQNP